MAPKKKTKKKKLARAKKTARTAAKPKKGKVSKKPTKKTSASNQAAKKKAGKKKPSGKAAGGGGATRKRSQGQRTSPFSRETAGPRSGEQAGDLQGLSNVENADSESVDELLEEGNALEAGVVAGVEEAGEGGDREVRTREVPEDDVPSEYWDEK
jgi:hypothetical protein